MLETLASFQVRCSPSSWNQPCNFSCIFNRFLLLFTNPRCSKSSSSLSVMDGKMQERIKRPSPSCFILQLRALILTGIVPVISGFQEKIIIICCLSTALLILLCLLLEWRDQEDVCLEQGTGQQPLRWSWGSDPSDYSNICSSSQERAPLQLIKGREKKVKMRKKTQQKEKNWAWFLKRHFLMCIEVKG